MVKLAHALLAVAGLVLPATAVDPILQTTVITGPSGAQTCDASLAFTASVVALAGTPTGKFQFLDNSATPKVLCETAVGTGGKADPLTLSLPAIFTLLNGVLNGAGGVPAGINTNLITAVTNAVTTIASTLPTTAPIITPVTSTASGVTSAANTVTGSGVGGAVTGATGAVTGATGGIVSGRRLLLDPVVTTPAVSLAGLSNLLTSTLSADPTTGVLTPITGTNLGAVTDLLNALLANSLYTVTCNRPAKELLAGSYSYNTAGVGLSTSSTVSTILGKLGPKAVLPASFTIPTCTTPTPDTPGACPTGITIGTSTPEISFPACLAPTFTVTLTGLPATATSLPTVSINGFGGNLLKQILSPTDVGFSIAKGLTATASVGSTTATVTTTMPATSLKHGTYSAVATVDGCPALSAKVAFEQTVACLTKVNGRRMAM